MAPYRVPMRREGSEGMSYVDGFMAPLKRGRQEEYIAMARRLAALFLEHGAIHVAECVSETVPHGQVTDMYRAVAAEEGETLAFSWITWPSKAARDAGWEKAMADPRMAPAPDPSFDMKRMIFGGFDMVVDARAAGPTSSAEA